jgi:hypothetical protein
VGLPEPAVFGGGSARRGRHRWARARGQPSHRAHRDGRNGRYRWHNFGRAPDEQKTRRYFIAAESELWDFAPSGRDELCGTPLPPNVARNRRGGKLRYVQYTDETFTTKVLPNRTSACSGGLARSGG